MKPKTIGAILARMSFQALQAAAEINDRQRRADERLAALRKADAARPGDPRQAPNRDKRHPEYLFARNAQKKEEQYQRHQDFLAWEAEEMQKKRQKRTEEKGYL